MAGVVQGGSREERSVKGDVFPRVQNGNLRYKEIEALSLAGNNDRITRLVAVLKW